MTAPADALLFDLGNVVIEIDYLRAYDVWARSSGLTRERIAARFLPDEAYARHERGEIGLAEYFEHVRGVLGVDLDDAALLEGWNSIYVGEIGEVVALLERLRERVALYAFSNTNRTHQAYWEPRYASALTPFRKVFLSHDLGRRKPEREAFEAISAQIGVPLSRVLFFDDLEENVAGARAAGMPAVLVRSPEDVRRAVAPWLEPSYGLNRPARPGC